MSRAPLESINIAEAGIGPRGGDRQPPRMAPNQPSPGESGFVDSSGPIFSMYLEMAVEEDKKMAESWKADAEGILVFTGLFSAAVASLISVSIQDLRQNPQDTSNFYLANMYQVTIADPNRSNISSSLPASPPPFSPPTYAVWVNSLWFLSLAISITCALLATLLQQWARRYLNATPIHYSLHKRARINSFFAEGVEKSLLPLAVEALPALIHVSLFLFFAGLAVFLWNVNLTIFKVVLSWISVCTAVYGFITLTPILLRNSPYYTPLTLLAWPIFSVILKAFLLPCEFFYILISCCCGTFCSKLGRTNVFGSLSRRLFHSLDMIAMTPEKVALASPSKIDARALMWTFGRLDEDHELQRFFSGLPGFHNSRVLKQPLHSLDEEQKLQLLTATIGLLDRTFSSDLLPDQVKRQRVDICTNTIDLLDIPTAFPEIVRRLATEDGYGPVKSTKLLQFLQHWGNRKGEDSTLVQALFSVVVARARQHDDSWFSLASELGILEPVPRSHAAHGDTTLAILIHITRQQFAHIQNPSWPSDAIANVLEGASRFNAKDTSPKLQHKFCALWNQAVRQVRNNDNWCITIHILKSIRNVYVSLHQGTDSAPRFTASTDDLDVILNEQSEYPECKVAGHIIDEPAPTTIARTVPVDGVVPATAPSTSPDAPSLPEPAPLHVDEGPTTLPALDNSHPTHQAVESFSIPITSPGSTTAGAIQDVVTLGITAPYPTPETSISAPLPLRSPTSPPSAVSLQYNAPLTPPDSLNSLTSASNPVLNNMLPTVSHRSTILTTTPSASPGLVSTPEMSTTTTEVDGISKLGFHKEIDALEPRSVNRPIYATTMATPDLPQCTSPSSVTNLDVAVVGPSMRESSAERIEHHPPDPSRYQYDIV